MGHGGDSVAFSTQAAVHIAQMGLDTPTYYFIIENFLLCLFAEHGVCYIRTLSFLGIIHAWHIPAPTFFDLSFYELRRLKSFYYVSKY